MNLGESEINKYEISLSSYLWALKTVLSEWWGFLSDQYIFFSYFILLANFLLDKKLENRRKECLKQNE